MTRENSDDFFAGVIGRMLIALVFSTVLTGSAAASDIVLNLEDAPLGVVKNSSKTRKIIGIPANEPGSLRLKMKWHAESLIPNTFNKLKIVLLHASTIIRTSECYSQHSDKTPKCEISLTISQTEVNREGDWKLRVENDSDHNINGFNIVKESSDSNPFVPGIKSVFTPDCSLRELNFWFPEELNISGRSTVEKNFDGVTNIPGELQITAKWHTDLPLRSAVKLKIELLRDEEVVASDEGFSIHAGEKDKINIKLRAGANQGRGTSWKLRIKNIDIFGVVGFNIRKGNDANPLVPNFRSVYLPCR